jgi:hypothetical protein
MLLAGGLRIPSWRGARTRNAAGIQSAGRGLAIGGLLGRQLRRRLWLRARMLFANRERRRRLADQVHLQSATEAAQLLGNTKGVFMKVGRSSPG